MRALIRKLLGVENVDLTGYVKRADLKEAVAAALKEAFEPEPPSLHYWDRGLRGNMERAIRKHAREQGGQAAAARLDELVKPEQFIDDVVTRIKSKQLAG